MSVGEKKKAGFVILHYNDIKVTSACISSILKLKHREDAEIVILDNHSPNQTGKVLQEKYAGYDNITVLLLEENYGFSRANNIGYQFLLKKTPVRFMVVANNDIVFRQEDMLEILEREYEKKQFYVAGPDVYNVAKKTHQSPLAPVPRTIEETKRRIREAEKKRRHVRMETILHRIWLLTNQTRIYRWYRTQMDKKLPAQETEAWKQEKEGVVLSGACLFFSEKFLREEEKPFTPETRFYYEEDILACKCWKRGWKISYLPEIRTDHLEGISTKHKNYYQRMKFRYEHLIQAGKIYIDYLQKEKSS